MTSSQDILAPTLSNGRSYHFDVAVDDRNAQDKLLLMIAVTYDTEEVWTTSFYENEVDSMAKFVAETLMRPDEAQTSDVNYICSLLRSITSHSKRVKHENSS